MNKISILLVVFCVFVSVACRSESDNSGGANQSNQNVSKSSDVGNKLFTVEFKTEPAQVKSGEKAKLIFAVKNERSEMIRDFDLVHEKLMHLLIVSEDLEEFYHEHPEVQSDGSFAAGFTFTNGGKYKLYADFKPTGTEQTAKDFSLDVSGSPRASKELKADEKFEKTVGDLRVVMAYVGDLVTNKELMLEFQVFDAKTNAPVTDLENYLGAKAHFVVISRDLEEFVHAHPMSQDNVKSENEKLAGASAQSIVSAHISFPKQGLYRLWAQFKRGGKVTTVPFTFEVKQGEAERRLEKVEIPKGAYKIVVSRDGFTPEEVTFKQGQPLKLAFFRADSENCGSEVVFKDLNIRKTLPVGEVVVIDIPTNKAREINFACGMSMYKGKIIIE
jgi:Cupredoxin-like domain